MKNYKWYLTLYASLFFYSFSSVMAKFASQFSFFSWQFLLRYSASFLILMIYAIVWQQVLKHFDLSTAYANKPLVTIFSVIWGIVLFDEHLTWNMLLGIVILLFGIRMVVTSDE